MTTIDSFNHDNAFLSNFFVHPVFLLGTKFMTAEHAYQFCKTTLPDEKEMILNASTPGIAKRLGQKVTIRPDWEAVKIPVMRIVVTAKFKDPMLKNLLLATNDAILIEGNPWGDTFWGVCDGIGDNNLGKLLMSVRKDLAKKALVL